MIVVIDDLFDQEKINYIVNDLPNIKESDGWFDKGVISYLDEIATVVNNYFLVENAAGYEMHKNVVSLGMHYDKDQLLYKRTGRLSYPICGVVYYPKIENMSGGELVFDDASITPKTNRLVIFKGDLYHGVNPHTGTRISLGINPWLLKPLAYRI